MDEHDISWAVSHGIKSGFEDVIPELVKALSGSDKDAELVRKDALLEQAALAIKAIEFETCGGIYACYVNELDWWDFTKDLITKIEKEVAD